MLPKNFKYDNGKKFVGPVSILELETLYSNGKITGETQVYDVRLYREGKRNPPIWTYSQLTSIAVKFQPPIQDFMDARADKSITVLSGPNNSGKSLLLKQLYYWADRDSHLLHCNRFSHVDILNSRQLPDDPFGGYQDGFLQNYFGGNTNSEDSPAKLEQVITGLTQPQIKRLYTVCGELLNCALDTKRVQPDRPFSPWYVDIDGQNLKYSSTGTRLLLTLVGLALDDKIATLFIDEPELGLSPKLQSALAKTLYDNKSRRLTFPNLKRLVIATHSHLFLDRHDYSNNWTVSKSQDVVSVHQVSTPAELHQLQFNMLGNDLESMFLPSAVLIVEGESDVTYLRRVINLQVPNRKITVARAGGDGEVTNKFHFLTEVFGELQNSPYRSRLFGVLDLRNSVKKSQLLKLGVLEPNITIWPFNGVEYLYPKEILAAIFHCSEKTIAESNLESDPIVINGISKSKKRLAEEVSQALNASHVLPVELQQLVERVRKASG